MMNSYNILVHRTANQLLGEMSTADAGVVAQPMGMVKGTATSKGQKEPVPEFGLPPTGTELNPINTVNNADVKDKGK